MFKRVLIRSFEMGLRFHEGEFRGLVSPGRRWIFDPLGKEVIRVVSRRAPWLVDDQLDLIVRSGALDGQAEVVDLDDHQRALVWIDGRFARILSPGLHVYWTGLRDVRVEVIDAREVRLQHAALATIARAPEATTLLDVCRIERDHVGVLFYDGRFVEEVTSGLYAFWRGVAESRIVEVDQREQQVDVSGQEIMTSDKVTLRMNAVVTWMVRDARRAVTASSDFRQSMYREVQLALRAIVGARELDGFLVGKDDVAVELMDSLRKPAGELGLEVTSIGIRDVILPGDMKDLMNRVTEARKAAEADLISRREETAAIRSQANTAKLLSDNPTLMRLRELEVLEKIATAGKMNIVLGEKGLSDRVINLL